MRSTPSLPFVSQLRQEYPMFTFQEAADFSWSHATQTINFNTSIANWEHFILHELSHALLSHTSYAHDMDLIRFERDAWNHVKHTLSHIYEIIFDEDIAQNNLDTYRDWLHARSTCPSCMATGLQTSKTQYRCLGCDCTWRVNEARTCALRRHVLITQTK